MYGHLNQLVCLPTLPNSLTDLSIDAEKISCLPNMTTNLKVYDSENSLIPIPPLCPAAITYHPGLLGIGTYVATQTIQSASYLPKGTANYYAGQAILLNSGFETYKGSSFSVQIRGCQ